MVRKGGFSFVAMLVINPIVILFYQNCSMLPSSQARAVASISDVKPVQIVQKQAKVVCQGDKASCPAADIE